MFLSIDRLSRSSLRGWCLVFCLIPWALPAFGQVLQPEGSELAAEGRFLSSEQQVARLVQTAFRQHPHLVEAASEIRREAGLRWQATRRPNPSAGYTASEMGNEGRGGQQGLFLSQQWVTAGKLEMAGQAAQWRTRAAMERMKTSRLQLSGLVQSQYWALVAARRRVELLSRLERSLAEAVEINQALLEAAEISQGTLIQAMLEKNQMSVAVRQSQIDVQARSQALGTTLNTSMQWIDSVPNDPWPVTSSDFFLPLQDSAERVLPADYDTQQWLSLSSFSESGEDRWMESPELSEVNSLIEAAKWELRLAQVRVVSDIDSYASVQHDAVTNNVIVGVQVGMFLPVNDRKTGLIEAARATVNQLEARLSSIQRDIQIRWTLALNDYRSALEMKTAIENDLMPLAQRRFDLARQAYAHGEIDYLELLTAQRSFLTIQQNALEMQERATLAAVRLTHLVVPERTSSF